MDEAEGLLARLSEEWNAVLASSADDWVWYSYIRLEASQTDLDAYAIGLVEGLVDAWQALNLEINGR